MIGTAQAALLVLAEPERYATMRAEFVEQADLSLAVAKAHQALAHQLRAYRRAVGLWNFRREQERRPIAPQQLTHQCSRADAA